MPLAEKAVKNYVSGLVAKLGAAPNLKLHPQRN